MKRILCALALLGAYAHLAECQVAVLHIRVVEGEGAISAPGSHNARPLLVEVTDDTGKPVEGVSVSFHLPEEGPGGTFGNGLRTDVTVTDSRGRAALHTMQMNRTPGRFGIRIVASKEQARAGMVSFQNIAELKAGETPTPPSKSGGPSLMRGPFKWVVIGALAACAGAAGMLAAGHSSGSPAPAATPATPASTITIGNPTITVGKP